MARQCQLLDHLNVYGGYIPTEDGGRVHQLAPAPVPAVPTSEAKSNVIEFRRKDGELIFTRS